MTLSKRELNLFKFPEKPTVSTQQKVISGIRKNSTQAIILSSGINSKTKILFVDIRLWVMDSDAEKYVPTPKGIRFNMEQYASFCTILQDEFPVMVDPSLDVKVISVDSFMESEHEIINPFSKEAQYQRDLLADELSYEEKHHTLNINPELNGGK